MLCLSSCSQLNNAGRHDTLLINGQSFLQVKAKEDGGKKTNIYINNVTQDVVAVTKIVFDKSEDAASAFYNRRLYFQKFYEKIPNPYTKFVQSNDCLKKVSINAVIRNNVLDYKMFFVIVSVDKEYKLSNCSDLNYFELERLDIFLKNNLIYEFRYSSKNPDNILNLNPESSYELSLQQ